MGQSCATDEKLLADHRVTFKRTHRPLLLLMSQMRTFVNSRPGCIELVNVEFPAMAPKF